MDTLLFSILPVLHGGLGNLAAYLAAHVLLCLLPAFFIAGAMAALLADPGIVRNRAKVAATIQNAKAFLDLTAGGRTFSDFLWQFVGGEPIQNGWRSLAEVPASTAVRMNSASNRMAK